MTVDQSMRDEAPSPVLVSAPKPIQGAARGSCVLVSLAGFVAGGLATFKTSNGIGTGGLLLVGTFFGLIALLGRVPRLKWGENELDPHLLYAAGLHDGAERTAEAAQEAAEETDDAKQVAARAEEFSNSLSDFQLWQLRNGPIADAVNFMLHHNTTESRAVADWTDDMRRKSQQQARRRFEQSPNDVS